MIESRGRSDPEASSAGSRRLSFRRRLLFSLISVGAFLLLLELGLRLLVQPSERCFGTLIGQPLSPCDLGSTGPWSADETPRDEWFDDLVVDGRRISVGDLWGMHRGDPLLGYAPAESVGSLNGWWQSNNIGARAREDTTRDKPSEGKRVLVFGDSYAQGSRVPQEAAWPLLLDDLSDTLEVVNLGVDGYSLAQAFLRYRLLQQVVDHDIVLLMFVPRQNLWRDINTVRSLAQDWDFWIVLPRFVVEGDDLDLIVPPRSAQGEAVERAELEDHLRRYDRFYFASEYREPRILGHLVLYRVFDRARVVLSKRRLMRNLLEPTSEAVRVSKKIIEEMSREVVESGAQFILALLPSRRDLAALRRDPAYRRNWKALLDSTCGGGVHCIDLRGPMLAAPPSQLDAGYDGTHYGPRAQRLIAESIRAQWPTSEALSAGTGLPRTVNQ